MDKEPTFSSGSVMSRLEIFADADFIDSVRATETTLADSDIAPRNQRKYIKTAIETLNEHFGTEDIYDTVDVAGYAYIADKAGRLLRDETGAVVEGGIECDEVTYFGIDIIDIRNQQEVEDKEKLNYKVVCRFKRTTYADDGTKSKKTYYIPPNNVLAFQLSYEQFDENEYLKDKMDKCAAVSEETVRHYTFTLARGREQHRILWYLANELADDIVSTYGNSTVTVNTSEFFVMTPTDDGESPEIHLFDQYATPLEERVWPTGKVIDCQFIESILNKGNSSVKLKSLIRECPCMVLAIENSNATCLIPIRAFNFADVIDEN